MEALNRVKRGGLTVVPAATLMGLSLCQGRRVWKRFRGVGDVGLVHMLRGSASSHRLSPDDEGLGLGGWHGWGSRPDRPSSHAGRRC
ncbi:MAG: hypothetical protein K8T91_03805 [Planctomycetes bacterium]|nr:hypothetical protein [Planctomycetota bacterium]